MRRRRVLVVDDNIDTRDLYAQCLALAGMDVATADDGEAGVRKALEWMPDIVLMDLSMPKLTGDQAARILQADPRTRQIPVVILSAFGLEARAKVEAAGSTAVCAKPSHPQDLVALVERFSA
jgi:CheY-like chemotaxis protein